MKIGIVSLDNSNTIQVGGKHVHQNLLAKAFRSLEHEVEFFFPKRSLYYLCARIFFKLLEKYNFRSVSRSFEWTLRYFEKSLTNQINSKHNCDVYFCQDSVSAVAVLQSKFSSCFNVILTLHGYLGYESVNYLSLQGNDAENASKLGIEYDRQAVKGVNAVICVDSNIPIYLKNTVGWSGDPIILKNAIDPEVFGNINHAEQDKPQNEYGIKGQTKVILIPRRLVRKNGVDIALSAFAQLSESDKDRVVLLVAGDGPEKGALLKQSLDLGISKYVHFLGSIPNDKIPQLYLMSDLVLIPSVIRDGVEEATSLSMLEAMAARRLVVVSNIGGMKEVIRNNENGFSFENGDVEGLTNVLNIFLNRISKDEYEKIVERAYNDVIDKHHYINHAHEYLKCVK